MEEKVGFRRALSASIVLGVYSGFMLAVAIAMSVNEDGFQLAVFLWGVTIVVSALFLTPVLANSRKRGLPDTDQDVNQLRLALEEFNEGMGGWRTLSHVRGEGMGVSVSLSNASNPLTIIEKSLQVAENCKIAFRFPKHDTSLRDRTLPILEEKVGISRIQRRTKSLTVMPERILDRSTIITRVMMLCPPLMAAGAMGFYSVSPEQPTLLFVGAAAGAILGMLVVTNKGR